jgi:hypothetical protein
MNAWSTRPQLCRSWQFSQARGVVSTHATELPRPLRVASVPQGGAGNSVKSSAPEESKFLRADCVPKPTSKGRFRARLLDTACRVDSCVTHSKQTTEVHVTRHRNEGGRATELSPYLVGAPSFRRRRWATIGPVAATNSAQRSASRAPLWKCCPPKGGLYEDRSETHAQRRTDAFRASSG